MNEDEIGYGDEDNNINDNSLKEEENHNLIKSEGLAEALERKNKQNLIEDEIKEEIIIEETKRENEIDHDNEIEKTYYHIPISLIYSMKAAKQSKKEEEKNIIKEN